MNFLTDAEKFDVTNFFCNNFPPTDVVDTSSFVSSPPSF